MVKIIMAGCNGRMGRVISDIVKKDEEAVIVAGVDIFDDGHNDYPVFDTIDKIDAEADVIIDFSSPKLLEGLLSFAENRKMPIVLCSTGYESEQIDTINAASKNIAILRSGNMSLGINTVVKALEAVSKTLADAGFDIEIVEKHHNQKLDAPSGTALLLADAVNNEIGNDYDYNYDRSKEKKKREKKEIGISAVRGGTIVGEHEIIFAGIDEVIEIKHTAYSRAIFGNGAVNAAKFLKGKTAGMYSMKEVVDAN
ncbi:MAG: 4-hydroxy-tetrahydrodipicolinate reductase [Lachnospiraceae bacterium]|nr:4-hydroxy-tetrahydrodipicolinate reductase [Lachnospiraceae bacterium]